MAWSDDRRTGAVIAAAIEAHRALGPGFLERVYHMALEAELSERGVPFRSEVELPVACKGIRLRATYRADMVCFGDILVEMKAQASIGRVEAAQVIHCLKASSIPVGLLVNFGAPLLQVRRFVGPEHFTTRQQEGNHPPA